MSRLVDPKVAMAMKGLSLAARMTVDGFMRGINKSSVKGTGLEFSQYRSYQPGDDLRSLDWKMFARSDRYYIRESEVETNIAIRFLVDASASMKHKDGNFTKMDYARYLTGALAYLANLQGDAIGLDVFNENGIFALAPKQSFQHLNRLFYQLEQMQADGTFTSPVHYQQRYAGMQKREMLVFITDMYEQHGEILNLLETLSARHEVLVFHLIAANELDLDFEEYSTFEDLETGKIIHINAAQAKASYQQKMSVYLEETRLKLLDRNIYYTLMQTDEPLDQALRDFLNQRTKLKR